MRDMPALSLAEFETQPFQMTLTGKIDAPAYAVFAELSDPSLWYPLMRRSRWMTGATSGVGAEREVDVIGFGRFRERMLAWDPGERVAFTMIRSTSPLFVQLGEDIRVGKDGSVEWRAVGRLTRLGRALAPALRAPMRMVLLRGLRNLEQRAASYPARGRDAS